MTLTFDDAAVHDALENLLMAYKKESENLGDTERSILLLSFFQETYG